MRPAVAAACGIVLALVALAPTVSADGVPPDSPHSVKITPYPDGSIGLTWQAPDFTGSGPIDHYTVERLTSAGWSFLGFSEDESFLDTAIAQGSGFGVVPQLVVERFLVGYRVTAYNTDGEWADSVVVSLIVPESTDGGQTYSGCAILTTETSPPRASFDGACAIFFGTDPLPEPYRDLLRGHLIFMWTLVVDILDKFNIHPEPPNQ